MGNRKEKDKIDLTEKNGSKKEQEIIQILMKKIENKNSSKSLYNDMINSNMLNLKVIDTDDDVNEVGEFQRWKHREMSRLKRDKKEREKVQGIEKMSHYKVKEYNKINNCDEKFRQKPSKERTKMKFLQKYYHKGSFFQAESDDKFGSTGLESIYLRDFNKPTAMDNFDKTLLPTIMQVKNFGRRGRTKWTHLLAEDTSNKEHLNIFDKTNTSVQSHKLKKF